MTEFYKNLKGYKVNIATRNGAESFIGLIAKVYDDQWIELVPFDPTTVEQKFQENDPDVKITPVPTPVFKRISTIDTIIVLEKPDKTYASDEDQVSEDK